MFGAESTLTPNLPGVTAPAPVPGMQTPNPFQGIRRAGQAKRAQNFARFQQNQGPHGSNPNKSFSAQKNRLAGGDVGTLVGSMGSSKLFS